MSRAGAADDVDLTRDRALVEQAQAGDPAAFGELYTRYFRRLVRFSAKRVGDVHEAEEIAQEAFARAYRALPTFAGERRFYPWMTVIASRLCVDSLRRRGRVEVGEVADLEFVEPGFDRLDAEGDIHRLQQAMSHLSVRHREVLDLREHRGWSYQHIADHYDVSIGTVEALIWRARKALRREFTSITSALLVVPGLRRVLIRTQAGTPTIAALGSVATAVALSLGGLTTGVAQAAPPPVAMVRTAASGTQVRTPPAPAPPEQVTAAAARNPGAALTPVPERPPATQAPTAHTAGSSLPIPTVVSGSDAAAVGRQQPIAISVGSSGPVIGLNPPVPVPHIEIHIGGTS